MKQADETDRANIEMCGVKITNRTNSMPKTATNPNGKSNCDQSIAEPETVTQRFMMEV